jgi:hypothetical protein
MVRSSFRVQIGSSVRAGLTLQKKISLFLLVIDAIDNIGTKKLSCSRIAYRTISRCFPSWVLAQSRTRPAYKSQIYPRRTTTRSRAPCVNVFAPPSPAPSGHLHRRRHHQTLPLLRMPTPTMTHHLPPPPCVNTQSRWFTHPRYPAMM